MSTKIIQLNEDFLKKNLKNLAHGRVERAQCALFF